MRLNGPIFSFLYDAPRDDGAATTWDKIKFGMLAAFFGLIVLYVGLAMILPVAALLWWLL